MLTSSQKVAVSTIYDSLSKSHKEKTFQEKLRKYPKILRKYLLIKIENPTWKLAQCVYHLLDKPIGICKCGNKTNWRKLSYNKFCSKNCAKREPGNRSANRKAKEKIFKKFQSNSYKIFTEKERKTIGVILQKINLTPPITNKHFEAQLVQYLNEKYPKLCEKYVNLPATTVKGKYFLLFNKPKVCTCGNFITYYEHGGSSHCSASCAGANPETKRARKQTCLEKYGVTHVAQDTEVMNKIQKSSKSRKEYTLGKSTVMVQGFEHFALDLLLKSKVNPSKIKVSSTGKVPRITYLDTYEGKERYYFPDIYIPSQNKLIEVKSVHTLLTFEPWFITTACKAKACIKQGYEFELFLMERDGSRISLPKSWYKMPYSKVKRKVY
jgi:hypothetical protein